jgi:hypothetical protein
VKNFCAAATSLKKMATSNVNKRFTLPVVAQNVLKGTFVLKGFTREVGIRNAAFTHFEYSFSELFPFIKLRSVV